VGGLHTTRWKRNRQRGELRGDEIGPTGGKRSKNYKKAVDREVGQTARRRGYGAARRGRRKQGSAGLVIGCASGICGLHSDAGERGRRREKGNARGNGKWMALTRIACGRAALDLISTPWAGRTAMLLLTAGGQEWKRTVRCSGRSQSSGGCGWSRGSRNWGRAVDWLSRDACAK
jgi:hypothetical protein